LLSISVMPYNLRTTRVNDKRDPCVTQSQKAVYYWNESRHSDDDVVDILSSEWHQRLTFWHAWLVNTYGSKHVHLEPSKLYKTPEDLEFEVFFFAHPIPTFSLWHVFEAFYDLDKIIYGLSSEADLPPDWRQMKPFKYLKSPDVRRRWKKELKKIGHGGLTVENAKSRMFDVLRAVEKLEYSLKVLEEDLGSDKDSKIEYGDWILGTARNAFEERCAMIAEALKPGVKRSFDGVVLTEVEDSYVDDLGSST
jgi:hypothetical protein